MDLPSVKFVFWRNTFNSPFACSCRLLLHCRCNIFATSNGLLLTNIIECNFPKWGFVFQIIFHFLIICDLIKCKRAIECGKLYDHAVYPKERRFVMLVCLIQLHLSTLIWHIHNVFKYKQQLIVIGKGNSYMINCPAFNIIFFTGVGRILKRIMDHTIYITHCAFKSMPTAYLYELFLPLPEKLTFQVADL